MMQFAVGRGALCQQVGEMLCWEKRVGILTLGRQMLLCGFDFDPH